MPSFVCCVVGHFCMDWCMSRVVWCGTCWVRLRVRCWIRLISESILLPSVLCCMLRSYTLRFLVPETSLASLFFLAVFRWKDFSVLASTPAWHSFYLQWELTIACCSHDSRCTLELFVAFLQAGGTLCQCQRYCHFHPRALLSSFLFPSCSTLPVFKFRIERSSEKIKNSFLRISGFSFVIFAYFFSNVWFNEKWL